MPLGFWHITYSSDLTVWITPGEKGFSTPFLAVPFALTVSHHHVCHSTGEFPWNHFDTSMSCLGLLISKLAEKKSNELALDPSANNLLAKAFLILHSQGSFKWSCLISGSVQQWKNPKGILFASAQVSWEAPREAAWLAKAAGVPLAPWPSYTGQSSCMWGQATASTPFEGLTSSWEYLDRMPLLTAESALLCTRMHCMKISLSFAFLWRNIYNAVCCRNLQCAAFKHWQLTCWQLECSWLVELLFDRFPLQHYPREQAALTYQGL